MASNATSPDTVAAGPQVPVFVWYGLCALLIVADQASKLYVDANLALHRPVAFAPFFNWMLAYNEGAAFSFLSDAGGWQRWFFSALSLAVSVFLAVWLWRLERHARLLAGALSLILAGAIGNLIDRLAYGHVIDFIQFYYPSNSCLWGFYATRGHCYWPTFNVADACIFLGAFMLIAQSLFEGKPQEDA